MKKIKVYMGICSIGNVVDVQAYILRDIVEEYKDTVELVYPKLCVQRIFHDYARNEVVKDFLDTDCDVLWFLDSDVVPVRHTLDLITKHWDTWKVAGAPYPVFMAQPGSEVRQIVFTAYRGVVGGRGMAPSRIPYSGTDFVDGLATGNLFIKREVFDLIPKPYFEFKFDPDTRLLIEGEDLGFCLKLSKLGIKFFTDFSMVAKHYKNLCLLELNNYAIDYANKAVINYDTEIRVKAQDAVKKAFAAGKKQGESKKFSESILLP